MKLVVRLARYGIIHGDLNEFNLLITNSVSFFLLAVKKTKTKVPYFEKVPQNREPLLSRAT